MSRLAHLPHRSVTVNHSTGSERTTFSDQDSRSSAEGVHIIRQSPLSSDGRSLSSSVGSEDWTRVSEDEINPSDSASRPRHKSSSGHSSSRHSTSRHSTSRHRSQTEVRPPSISRHSSRRLSVAAEEPPSSRRSHRSHSRAHSERSDYRPHRSRRPTETQRRIPSDESGSVDSHDEYPGYSRGYDIPYRPAPSQYPHGSYDHGYGQGGQLVHMRQHDPFAYPPSNPFGPPPPGSHYGNAFAPPAPASSAGYFDAPPPVHRAHSHHRPMGPPRPQSYLSTAPSHYPPDMMSHYPPGYHMPYMYPYGTPSPGMEKSPSPFRDDRDEELAKMQATIKKLEDEKIAREKAQLAAIEAQKAAIQAKMVKELEDKRKAEEILEVKKKATAEAEKLADEKAKKAREEHDKAIAEAKKKAEELEKKKKDLEDEVKKHKPNPDEHKPPIKFKDAVGRKFTFPWHLCNTWKGMEVLIRQAFANVDVIGMQVMEGHFDLTGPNGEIILPQVWDKTVQPDWEVSMHMWPMPEPSRHYSDSMAYDAAFLAAYDRSKKKGKSGKDSKDKDKDDKKKKRSSVLIDPAMFGAVPMPPPPAGITTMPTTLPPLSSMPPPPPPTHSLSDPLVLPPVGLPAGIIAIHEEKKANMKVKATKKKDLPPLARWMSGGSSGSKTKSSTSRSSK